MNDEELLTGNEFLAEMVLLFQNRRKFCQMINGYFTPNVEKRHNGDRADKIIRTLQAGYFKGDLK